VPQAECASSSVSRRPSNDDGNERPAECSRAVNRTDGIPAADQGQWHATATVEFDGTRYVVVERPIHQAEVARIRAPGPDLHDSTWMGDVRCCPISAVTIEPCPHREWLERLKAQRILVVRGGTAGAGGADRRRCPLTCCQHRALREVRTPPIGGREGHRPRRFGWCGSGRASGGVHTTRSTGRRTVPA
jgi:hypothetical protein